MTAYHSKPPIISFPQNNAVLANSGFQSINFTWLNNNYYSTNSAEGTIYTLNLYEIPDDGSGQPMDANVAVAAGAMPVFSTQTMDLNYLYSGADPLLTPGYRYAIQVQAADLNGYDQYENQGYSQVVAFTYGELGQKAGSQCLSPTNLQVTDLGNQGIQLTWDDPNPSPVLDYSLSYSSSLDPTPIEKICKDPSLTLLQLPVAQYQFKVAATCDFSSKSKYSDELPYTVAIDPSLVDTSNNTESIADSSTFVNANEDPTPPSSYEPEAAPEAVDILNTPISFAADDLALPDSLAKILPQGASLIALPADASPEQQKAALAKKADCASYIAGYSCGNYNAADVPSGDLISVNAGDEVVMNSIKFEVVDLDASGNGSGIVSIPMFNNAKLGVDGPTYRFKNIKVAKGGCVVEGEADLSHVDVALLSEQQRAKIDAAFKFFNQALAYVGAHAEEAATIINSLAEFINKLKTDVTNYTGGKADAKKMKINFKAAEQYAKTILKNPSLSDSTRKALQTAYDEALKTKDFFCNGTECIANRTQNAGPFFENESILTPLCEENKGKLKTLSEILEKAQNSIKNIVVCNNKGIIISSYRSSVLGTEIFVQINGKQKSIGKLGETIDLNDILPNILAENKIKAKNETLTDWLIHVIPDGNWDYKSCESQTNSIFGLANILRDSCILEKKDKIFTKYQWLGITFSDASDIGNFNFGYTGRFVGNVGFKRNTLNLWAGRVQILKDFLGVFTKKGLNLKSAEKGFEEWWSSHQIPYGDELDDYQWSNLGMDVAEKSSNCPCPK